MRNYAPTDAQPRVQTPLADAIARYEHKGRANRVVHQLRPHKRHGMNELPDVWVKTYTGATAAETAQAFAADAALAGRGGYHATSQTWEGTSLTVTYQRDPTSPAEPLAAPIVAQPQVQTPLADAIARYEHKGYLVVWVRPDEALLVKPRAFQWAIFLAGTILTVGVLGALYLIEFWLSRDRIVRLTVGWDGKVTAEETRERPGVVRPRQPV